MNVTLIGMKYCGKSTLGAALARRWGYEFHDVDRLIEAASADETGRSLTVREVFAERGEQEFQRLEGLVVTDLFTKLRATGTGHVVAVGGRTATHPSVAGLLEGIGVVVYLRVPLEVLLARLAGAPLPGFLSPDNAAAEFARLFEQRRGAYERLAQVTVDLDGLGESAALERLVEAVEEYSDAR